jgi:hypothetical protein
VIYRL